MIGAAGGAGGAVRGVVEEDAFDEDLGEIHQVIVTADVGEFVEKDGLDLSGGEACEKAYGQQDDGSDVADDDRDFREAGFEKGDRAVHVKFGLEVGEAVAPEVGDGADAGAAEAAGGEPTGQAFEVEEDESDEPERDQPGGVVGRSGNGGQGWGHVRRKCYCRAVRRDRQDRCRGIRQLSTECDAE